MTQTAEARSRHALSRPFLVILPLAVILVVLAIFLGVADIEPEAVLTSLTGHGSEEARLIVRDIRIPRILTGMLAGIHFSVAGLLLQTITRNPLADPSIMGISQGATLAVTIFLFFTVYWFDSDPHKLYALPVAWLPAVGLFGGLAAGAVIYVLAYRRDLSPLRITLCGIAIGTVVHALAMGLIAGWGSARIEIVLQWLSGSLYARSWEHVLFLLPFTLAGLAALPFLQRSIDLLRFEAPIARSFGFPYHGQFSVILAIACALAASAVGVTGPIIFIGLAVPHLARFIAGSRFNLVMPLTALLGAVIITTGDLLGRLAGQAEEIPIGVVTAIGGAPILIALLRHMR
jgi:iron complex transport system permease protein